MCMRMHHGGESVRHFVYVLVFVYVNATTFQHLISIHRARVIKYQMFTIQ